MDDAIADAIAWERVSIFVAGYLFGAIITAICALITGRVKR